jgi:molybdopterin converting factor small subunit
MIQVKLHGSLRRHRPADAPGAPHQPFSLPLAAETTVAQLAAQLEIPDGLVSGAAVNGEAVATDTVLQDGDTVYLFPPSAGG